MNEEVIEIRDNIGINLIDYNLYQNNNQNNNEDRNEDQVLNYNIMVIEEIRN